MGIEETYEVWISREEIVDFLLYAASFDASVATRSNISECQLDPMMEMGQKINIPLTNEFRMDMARFEIPVSGWTCFKTIRDASVMIDYWR